MDKRKEYAGCVVMQATWSGKSEREKKFGSFIGSVIVTGQHAVVDYYIGETAKQSNVNTKAKQSIMDIAMRYFFI